GSQRGGAETRGVNAERKRRAGTLWGEDVETQGEVEKPGEAEKENGCPAEEETGAGAAATGQPGPRRGSTLAGLGRGVMSEHAKLQEEKRTIDHRDAVNRPSGLSRSSRPSRLTRPRLIKAAVVLLVVAALVMPWEASAGSDCALLLPPGHESAARANTDAVLAEVYVQPGDAGAEGAKIARLTNPELEDRLTQLNAEMKRLETNNSEIEEEMRMRSESLLSASFKEREHQRLASELKDESRQIASSGIASDGRLSNRPVSGTLPPAMAVLPSGIELKPIEVEDNREKGRRY